MEKTCLTCSGFDEDFCVPASLRLHADVIVKPCNLKIDRSNCKDYSPIEEEPEYFDED